jgi:hypothetical protein
MAYVKREERKIEDTKMTVMIITIKNNIKCLLWQSMRSKSQEEDPNPWRFVDGMT